MRAEALWALALATASGCFSSSIGGDVARVRTFANAPALASVDGRRVDPETNDDVQRILREPLDADAAVRVALLNNRALRATLHELGIARGRLVQAGLPPNPRVEAEVLPERNTELELTVEYDLTSAILAPVRAHAAKADLEAERKRAAAMVIEAAFATRAAFYAVQSAEQRLAIAQRALDAQAAARDAARALFAAGNVAEIDARTQEAAYARTRVSVAQLELEVASRREVLNRLLGLHGDETRWTTQGMLPSAPARVGVPDEIETRALEASLELGEARHRLEAVSRRIGVTRAEGWMPDLSVDVHSLYGNPERRPGEPVEGPWRFGGGVSLTVPLFNRRQGTLAAQQAELAAQLERYVGAAIDIRSAARDARNRLVSAHARARRYEEEIVPAQRRVTEQTLLQYNAMQIGIFQLLQARREELDVELAYVETLREYWTAAAAVDALLQGRRVSDVASTRSRLLSIPS
jgi:outer membrane protein TolC